MPYLDTSVVVAYYAPEPLSDRVQEIYRAYSNVAVSDLVEVEFFAALSLKTRVGDLERARAERIASLFVTHLADGLYDRLHLDSGHYRQARDYIAGFELPLKSPDALHLALCGAEDLELYTADRRLARNAEALEVGVELVEA